MINQELEMNEVYYEGKRLIVYGYKLNSVDNKSTHTLAKFHRMSCIKQRKQKKVSFISA